MERSHRSRTNPEDRDAGARGSAPSAASCSRLGGEGWRELLDYPNPQEHDELGIEYEYHSRYTRTNVSCRALGIDLRDLEGGDVAEAISMAESGDKLGGWPHWVQGIEYPSCPRCKRRMELVFQLASEDNIPYMFGDVGIGHITQCPEHPDVLTFAWACS